MLGLCLLRRECDRIREATICCRLKSCPDYARRTPPTDAAECRGGQRELTGRGPGEEWYGQDSRLGSGGDETYEGIDTEKLVRKSSSDARVDGYLMHDVQLPKHMVLWDDLGLTEHCYHESDVQKEQHQWVSNIIGRWRLPDWERFGGWGVTTDRAVAAVGERDCSVVSVR